MLNGNVVYSISTIGYSADSSTDQVVFRVDQKGETLWSTVLDYNLGFDFSSGLNSYGSTIYTGMYANNLYPWIITLNGVNWNYLLSKCFTFYYLTLNDEK